AILSVVFNGEESQLTNLRAVGSGYPLRGKVFIGTELFGDGTEAVGIPAPGEVWPDSRLLAAIGAKVGGDITIGSATLRVTKVLISRPDAGGTFSELAPSLLMNLADIPATQLIQPGSRVSYRALFAGDREQIDAFKSWLLANKKRSERLLDI